jgi:hypothetical protein
VVPPSPLLFLGVVNFIGIIVASIAIKGYKVLILIINV